MTVLLQVFKNLKIHRPEAKKKKKNPNSAEIEDLPTARIHLLDLPAEIRTRIYFFVFPSMRASLCHPAESVQPGITRANRQLRVETLATFYHRTVYSCCVEHKLHRKSNLRWLRSIGETNLGNIRSFEIILGYGRIIVIPRSSTWCYCCILLKPVPAMYKKEASGALKVLVAADAAISLDKPRSYKIAQALVKGRYFDRYCWYSRHRQLLLALVQDHRIRNRFYFMVWTTLSRAHCPGRIQTSLAECGASGKHSNGLSPTRRLSRHVLFTIAGSQDMKKLLKKYSSAR